MKSITVFTPTYNRAYTLERLYNSLLKQNYKEFEWLIIDDGSVDNTQELVNSFINENIIKINYIKTKNGGKHRAINKALDIVKSDLFFIVDSDDYLLENSLNKINEIFMEINDYEYCGISGLKAYSLSQIIGTTFKDKYKDVAMLDREKYNITGDKAEVFFTNIINKYRFSEYENENFLTEATMWNRISLDGYKIRYFNEIIYICEYLEDGLSKNIEKKYKENPLGFLEYIKQMNDIYKNNILKKIKYTSLYAYIFEGQQTMKEMSKKLQVSLMFLRCSLIIRKLLKRK